MLVSNPGRIGLAHIHGGVGVGIRVGQALIGAGASPWEHAFMDLGDGTIIEAEPGGARIRPLNKYENRLVHWCDGIYADVPYGFKQGIADAARELEGTPYSFLDYGAIAAHRALHLDTEWLKDYIGATGHLICSQLVDLACIRGGYDMLDNPDRWPGYVTPGDIWERDVALLVRGPRG